MQGVLFPRVAVRYLSQWSRSEALTILMGLSAGIHENKDPVRQSHDPANTSQHGQNIGSGMPFLETRSFLASPPPFLTGVPTHQSSLTQKLVPLLSRIRTKEPAVMLATLAVQEAMGLKVDREAVATLVLPQLWTMSMGPRM